MKKYNMIGTVLVVLLLGMSTAVATDTVTRTLQETASPADTIMVSLTIDFDDQDAVNRLVITETTPEGWAVVDASNSGNPATAGKITWMIITAIGGVIPDDGTVFTYNVTVPADANGVCSFSGVYGTNVAGSDIDLLGDVNVTIDGISDSPTLVAYTITNRTITPPQTTSIDVEFSEYVSATIRIENASGNLVKELYSSLDVKNPKAKVWNGTYTDGTSVPDDMYTVNVTGVNTTTGLSVINTSETITVITNGGTAPTVTASTPTGADVAISTVITATFSAAMNQTSAEDAFSISPLVNGSLGWDNDTMTFTPDADLAHSTQYDVTIGTGAEDLAGNALAADFVWNFTTVADANITTAPTVTASTPTGTDVAISTVITATFSAAMNQTSAEGAFSISPAVNGSLGWAGDMMTFTPDADLAYSTQYDVTIGTGAEDLAGNSLEESFAWNFTTESEHTSDVPTIVAILLPNAIISNGNDSTILEVQASSGSVDIGIASVTVNLSAIGGSDEQELQLDGIGIGGIGTWNTTISTTSVGTFDLTVTVTSKDPVTGAENSATADVTLTTGPHKYTLELQNGWNMISLPYNVTAVGIDTTQKLGDLISNAPDAKTSCHFVARYNTTSMEMECDLIGEPQDTSYPILGGQAYFVFVWGSKDVAVVGTLW